MDPKTFAVITFVVVFVFIVVLCVLRDRYERKQMKKRDRTRAESIAARRLREE